MVNTVLITGSNGFIGKNLYYKLLEIGKYNILRFDVENTSEQLSSYLQEADFIYHLAGVNRPKSEDQFEHVNTGLTQTIIDSLKKLNKNTPILLSSSKQAELKNAYGKSKKQAEDIIIEFSRLTASAVFIYRLTNVFGKWCRPNYNSVVATFCHNIAHDLPIQINDPDKQLELLYIDDVVNSFIGHLDKPKNSSTDLLGINLKYVVTLSELAESIVSFRNIRSNLTIPQMDNVFLKKLYATYLSYLPENQFSYKPEQKSDERGTLTELIKNNAFGQMFVSTTRSGIIRGNHYHHTKVEKFIVVKGRAIIRFKRIDKNEIIEYSVSDDRIEIVDIPPGYTHHIENIGDDEMVVLFWASEKFNPDYPDTYFHPVQS